MKQQVLEKCLEEIATMASEAVNKPLWKQHEALISIWAKARCQLPLQKRPVEGHVGVEVDHHT